MLSDILNCIGIDINALQVPDTVYVVVGFITFLFVFDWVLRLLSMVVGTLTKRR